MENIIKHQPVPDLAERIKKLGSPIGKTLKEIIDRLGYPQFELITSELVVEDEPFTCMWVYDETLYPLSFDHTFRCIEVHDVWGKFVMELFNQLAEE